MARQLWAIGVMSLTSVGVVGAADKPVRPAYTFSGLKAMSAATVKPRLETWLKAIGKFDAKAVALLWPPDADVTRASLATIVLGLPAAADVTKPGSVGIELPAVLADAKLDPFVRSNLAAAAVKTFASQRAYEEAAASAKLATPELVIDPAAYFFYRAVAEHGLMQRDAAVQSVGRLLDDVADAPDRYRVVATLLFFDLQSWPKDDKDLSNIGRLMDNSGRRLDLARGGNQTQDIQKRIVFKLDEQIKKLEQQQKQQAAGSAPGGGPAQPGAPGGQGGGPQQDSFGGGGGGPGQVDVKKLRNFEAVWGKLPEVERKKITQDFVRDMPAKYKPMIEDYFRSLNRLNGLKP